jgi:LysM repeat protein
MRTFKYLTLLILGSLIFGSAGYFGYILFIKPNKAERREKAAAAAAPAPTATPDPAIPEFERLMKLQAAGNTPAVRDGWNAWIAANPKSPLLHEGRRQLGVANMALFFNPAENPSMVTYSVVKGDSLAKIASKHHSNAELIQKANQLPGINLQIGQQLVIPELKLTLELDRAAKSLTLLNNGTYLKEYLLLSAPTAPSTPANITTKVLDKSVMAGTKRVAFGDKAYASSEKIILIAQAPSIVAAPELPATPAVPAEAAPQPATSPTEHGGTNAATATVATPAPTAPPMPPPMPGGYVLSGPDLQEIFALVSRNMPVIIH